MNLFKLDKAPYFFGLLITVISWHISQLVNEITRTQAVSYNLNIDRATRDVTLRISNVSHARSLINASFSLSCEGGEDCLEPLRPPEDGAEPVYGEVRLIPPHFVFSHRSRNTPSTVTVAATVAPGGRYDVVARLARSDGRVQFYYIPDPEHPLDIYIYDRHSTIGFLVENYLILLVVSFFAFVVLLLAWVVAGLKFAEPEPAPAPATAEPSASPAPAPRRSRHKGKDT